MNANDGILYNTFSILIRVVALLEDGEFSFMCALFARDIFYTQSLASVRSVCFPKTLTHPAFHPCFG